MKKTITDPQVEIGVVCFCHDGEGNILFAKRSKGSRDEIGVWNLCAGAIEFGDSAEETVHKEVREEFGVDVIEFDFLGYRDIYRMQKGIKTHWIALDFKVLIDPKKIKNNEPHKHDGVGFFKLENLPQPLHSQWPIFYSKYEKRLIHHHTSSELVDIVDAQCKVLYSTSKKEAHEKGLLHKTVIGGVRDSKGNFILIKQSSTRQDAGQYVAPVGGHVGAGESDNDAIRREAMEEIGLTDITFKLIGKKIFNRHVLGRQENHYFIVYEIFSDKPFNLSDEAVEYKKFTPSALKRALKKTPQIFGAAYHFEIQSFYPELTS